MDADDLAIQHYNDIIMSMMASQITSLTIVYSTVYSGSDQRKHQSSASLAFVRGIHRWPVNSPHKGPVMWKMFPLDDVIMRSQDNGSHGIDLVLWDLNTKQVKQNSSSQVVGFSRDAKSSQICACLQSQSVASRLSQQTKIVQSGIIFSV